MALGDWPRGDVTSTEIVGRRACSRPRGLPDAPDQVGGIGRGQSPSVGLLVRQHLLNRWTKDWQVGLGDVPDDHGLETMVFVAKYIADPGDLRPRRLGIPQLAAETISRPRSTARCIGQLRLKVYAVYKRVDPGDGVSDVAEPYPQNF